MIQIEPRKTAPLEPILFLPNSFFIPSTRYYPGPRGIPRIVRVLYYMYKAETIHSIYTKKPEDAAFSSLTNSVDQKNKK